MKIILCGSQEINDLHSWSGTSTILYNNIPLFANRVGVINYGLFPRVLVYMNKVYSRIRFGIKNSIRDPLQLKIYEYFFKKNAMNLPLPDIYFHISEIAIPQTKSAKHVVYTDAAIDILNNELNTYPDYYNRMLKKVSMKYISRADMIFTFNEWTKNNIIREMKFPEDRVINVGFGINCEPFYGKKNYSNQRILTILRKGHEKRKGLDLLLKAFVKVKQQFPNAILDVVGTSYNTVDGVCYYENEPRSKTQQLLEQASLYCMPALNEPNGITYLEALACRTPIVGLNRYAFPEFSGQGNYGFIVELPDPDMLAETIIKALSDPDKLAELGEKGQKYVLGKFNWDSVIKNMVNKMEELING